MKPLPNFIPAEQRNARITLSMTVPDPQFWADLDRLKAEHDARQHDEERRDLLILKRGYNVLRGIELTASVPVLLYPTAEGIGCLIGGKPQEFDMLGYPPEELREMREFLAKDNAARGISKPKPIKQALPAQLPQATFMEARAVTHALSDARDLKNWEDVEGDVAMLHRPAKAQHQVGFEPHTLLTSWWGYPATPQALKDELKAIGFESIVTFKVVLACILQSDKARWTGSLDDLIKLIGRNTEARRSEATRNKLRREIWRYLLIFDSFPVFGMRPGTWREPAPKGHKGEKMPEQKLISRDPLLRIVGTRDTEQGTLDSSAPPKEVSLVAGEWLMQFHGDRRFLAEYGDVLNIASIPRGKPSGAWAACVGLMLQQLWREQAAHAPVARVGQDKHATMSFRPFTRRELLAETLRSDDDVNVILSDATHGYRAPKYWKAAIKELKTRGVIGFYEEGPEPLRADWREAWLEQPLNIRPTAERLQAALEIHHSAQEAKKRAQRGRPRLPKSKTQEGTTQGEE
jgi:hypothetical protein